MSVQGESVGSLLLSASSKQSLLQRGKHKAFRKKTFYLFVPFLTWQSLQTSGLWLFSGPWFQLSSAGIVCFEVGIGQGLCW